MTNISEVINEAIALTGRPDKRSDGISFANAAISKIVRRTTWPFDRLEVPITFTDQSLYTQTINISTQLPNFRKINYVRSPSLKMYEMLDPASIVDGCGRERLPSFYISGTNIILKDEVQVSQVMVGYFALPPRLVESPQSTGQTNTHWSLDFCYTGVMYAIMAEVFAAIGDDTSYGIYESKWQAEFAIAARDFRDMK